jgi:hypothetical protein
MPRIGDGWPLSWSVAVPAKGVLSAGRKLSGLTKTVITIMALADGVTVSPPDIDDAVCC